MSWWIHRAQTREESLKMKRPSPQSVVCDNNYVSFSLFVCLCQMHNYHYTNIIHVTNFGDNLL